MLQEEGRGTVRNVQIESRTADELIALMLGVGWAPNILEEVRARLRRLESWSQELGALRTNLLGHEETREIGEKLARAMGVPVSPLKDILDGPCGAAGLFHD